MQLDQCWFVNRKQNQLLGSYQDYGLYLITLASPDTKLVALNPYPGYGYLLCYVLIGLQVLKTVDKGST